MDKIEGLLKNPQTDLQKQALTDTSYKNIVHSLSDDNTNSGLATYGDAVLKLALCKVYWDKKNAGMKFSDNLSKWKEKHEFSMNFKKTANFFLTIKNRYDILLYRFG